MTSEFSNNENKDYLVNIIDCNITSIFCQKFFNNDLKTKLKDMVFAHVLECQKCQNKYSNYAREIGLKGWTPHEAAFKFISELSLEDYERYTKTRDILIDTYKYSHDDFVKSNWVDKVEEYKVEELLQLQPFRDLINEYNNKVDKGDVDYVPYYKHIMKKIAQKIDHLEECYKKDTEEKDQ